MANRVTGAQSVLLALAGIVYLSSFGLSQGIDRDDGIDWNNGIDGNNGVDWNNGAKLIAESSGFIGPQLLPTELDEASEVHTGDSQSEVATPSSAPVRALTPEQEQQIRVAYGTYLVSRVGAGNAINSGQITRVQPVGQSEAVADIAREVSLQNVPENVVEEDALTTASIALDKTTSAIARTESAIIAPVPASAALRPVLSVRPASVAVVQPARAVSVDHLVHVDVPRSWPRRLDQVNNGNNNGNIVSIAQNNQNSGGNVFLQDWQNNPQASNYQQAPNYPRQFEGNSDQFVSNFLIGRPSN